MRDPLRSIILFRDPNKKIIVRSALSNNAWNYASFQCSEKLFRYSHNDIQAKTIDTLQLTDSSAKRGMLIELERTLAQEFSCMAVKSGALESEDQSSQLIPILYAPDGAIHLAQGLADGIEHFSSHSSKIFTPGEDIDSAARAAGVVMICDDVVHRGTTLTKLLSCIPKDAEYTCIIYISHLYHHIMLEPVLEARADLKKLACFVNEMGPREHPLVDVDEPKGMSRAATIRYIDSPFTNRFKSSLKKREGQVSDRFLKDGDKGRS